jgi:hypothetical protein
VIYYKSIVPTLLQYGADPEWKDRRGKGLLDMISEKSETWNILQKAIEERSRWEKKPLRIEWIKGCVYQQQKVAKPVMTRHHHFEISGGSVNGLFYKT